MIISGCALYRIVLLTTVQKKRAIVNFQTLLAMMPNYNIFVVLDFFILHSHISCVTASGNAYFDGNVGVGGSEPKK